MYSRNNLLKKMAKVISYKGCVKLSMHKAKRRNIIGNQANNSSERVLDCYVMENDNERDFLS